MPRPEPLGGFKILRPALFLSMHGGKDAYGAPRLFCEDIARHKINLVFLNVDFYPHGTGAVFGIQGDQAREASRLIKIPGTVISGKPINSSIISLFPHKTRPEVSGLLIESLAKRALMPLAFAQSASAISAALSEEITDQVTEAVFEPFSFGPYRTPEDWSLAQKGKEQIYKEVIASYQEKRPKVYALAWQGGQTLVRTVLREKAFMNLASALHAMNRQGTPLSFFVGTPADQGESIAFSLTVPHRKNSEILIQALSGDSIEISEGLTAVFHMNGPHFGDRYGIAGMLLKAFDNAGLSLISLSCSVASITGVIAAEDMEAATNALSSVFEIPSVSGMN